MENTEFLSRRKFVAGALGATALGAFALSGCTMGSDDQPADGKPTETPAAETPDPSEPTTEALSGAVLAVGASAMQPLVEAAAQEFMKKYPDVNISVQAGGSGTGISSIAEGSVDIGNSDVFAEEKDVDPEAVGIVGHKICVVAMGPVVHADINLDNITKQQMKDIFTGKVTNWNEISGQDLPIIVINRAEGSGTRATFETFAIDGEPTITTQEQDSSGTTATMVAETPGAISYLAFSYVNEGFNGKALNVDGVEPTEENVNDNSWYIWAYEHSYTSKTPTPQTQAFIDFMMSDEVQNGVIPELGYLPISGMKVERSVEGKVTNL